MDKADSSYSNSCSMFLKHFINSLPSADRTKVEKLYSGQASNNIEIDESVVSAITEVAGQQYIFEADDIIYIDVNHFDH